MNLFNEAESEMDPAAEASDRLAATEKPEKAEKPDRKKRSTNEERLKGIPVKKVMLEPDATDLTCSKCGGEMVPIGTEFVRRELKIIPARATVIEYYSVNYACKSCRQNDVTPTIIKGKDGKAHMMYGMASASTVAWVVYQKFCNGMPLYRIGQDLGRLGAKISRATLANWVSKNRCCMNLNDVHRPSHICGCSAAVRMVISQSSFTSIPKQGPVIPLWIFWMDSADT